MTRRFSGNSSPAFLIAERLRLIGGQPTLAAVQSIEVLINNMASAGSADRR
jgi:hypothetical protein